MDFWRHFLEVTLGFVVEFVKLLPIMIFIFGFKLQSAKRIAVLGTSAVVLLILSAAFEIIRYAPIHTCIVFLLTLLIVRGNNRIIYTLISGLGIGILDMLTATIWLLFNDSSYGQLADDSKINIIVNAGNIVTILIICAIAKMLLSKQRHISPQSAGKSYLFLLLLG